MLEIRSVNSKLQMLLTVLVDPGQRIRKLAEDGEYDAMIPENVNDKCLSLVRWILSNFDSQSPEIVLRAHAWQVTWPQITRHSPKDRHLLQAPSVRSGRMIMTSWFCLLPLQGVRGSCISSLWLIDHVPGHVCLTPPGNICVIFFM